jgi:deoxyribonuclease V
MQDMKEKPVITHRWNLTPPAAAALQKQLAGRVIRRGLVTRAQLIAGGDCSFIDGGERIVAGIVVWDLRRREIVERASVIRRVTFPYVPGLLSFREAPALLAAARKLRCRPHAWIIDAHGLAHPRRFGLACHLGLWLDRPTIGCAKSRLWGEHAEPANHVGACAALQDDGDEIGRVVRTRLGVKPVFVSIGHRVTLCGAVRLVLKCSPGFRLPEPTRLAHQWVTQLRIAGSQGPRLTR